VVVGLNSLSVGEREMAARFECSHKTSDSIVLPYTEVEAAGSLNRWCLFAKRHGVAS
jgi:hypothetical protein